jgi:hypothetical protein
MPSPNQRYGPIVRSSQSNAATSCAAPCCAFAASAGRAERLLGNVEHRAGAAAACGEGDGGADEGASAAHRSTVLAAEPAINADLRSPEGARCEQV